MLGFLNPACFFLISVSYKLAWTAISSLLSQFARDFGPEVLLQLNIAYFLPSIPVLVLQTLGNEAMDTRLGNRTRGILIRFTTGLGGLALLTALFPSTANTHSKLLAVTTCVGIAYGIAFGTSYQLASRFPPACTVMLTTGFVSSGPIVLILDISIKRGPYYSPGGLATLFSAVSWITGFGLLAAGCMVLLNERLINEGVQAPPRIGINLQRLRSRPNIKDGGRLGSRGMLRNGNTGSEGPHNHLSGMSAFSQGSSHGKMRYRNELLASVTGDRSASHSSLGSWAEHPQEPHHAILIDAMEGGSSKGGEGPSLSSTPGGSTITVQQYDGKAAKPDLPLLAVAWRISPAMVSIFLSVGTSMLVFPYFTYVHSTGLLGERLAQVLFYIRLIGDVLGRLVPRRLQISTRGPLLAWAAVKTAMVPLMFISIFRPELVLGDAGAALYVGTFWLLSGYINTCSYLIAPTLVPSNAKPRASGLMTVAFQSSCFLALLGAAALQPLLVGQGQAAMGDSPRLH